MVDVPKYTSLAVNSAIDRRRFLRNSALLGAALAIPAIPSFARPASAQAAVASTKSFDLSAPSYPVFSGTTIHANTIMQCLAFDNVNQNIYVAQTTGQDAAGDSSYHEARGDLTVCKLDWNGKYLAWMKLEGCGHGFSMGVSNNADGSPEIWVEYGADTAHPTDGAAYGREITHTPWTDSKTRTAADLKSHLHNPRPGTYHNSPSIDPTNNRIAIRYQPVFNDPTKKVAVFKLSDVMASDYSHPLADITLPASCYKSAQGFTLWGDYLYFLSGAPESGCPETVSDSTSQLTKININTKRVTGPVNTYAFSSLGHREPEGMAIQLHNGTPRLCFGLAGWLAKNSTTCTTDRSVNVAYKDALTSS